MQHFLRDGSGGVLLADDMGLGKTVQTLKLLDEAGGRMFPCLVVCPASVKYVWERQAIDYFKIRAQVLDGRTPPTGEIGIVPKLMVINPDILPYWLKYFQQIDLKTLVLDESQMFSHTTAKRTKAAIKLARTTPYRIALSGTPLTNKPAELWPTLHCLRPDLFPAFFPFAQTYCQPKKRRWGWEYKGATNIPQLHNLLKKTVMIRRLKEDVLKDLPDKIRQITPIGLDDYAEYEQAKDDFLGWVAANYSKTRADRAAKAQAVTQIGYLLRLTARLKCRSVVNWANSFLEENPNEKLVLFAVHQKMIDVLQRRVNCKSVTIDGSVTGHARKIAVEVFRRDSKVRVLIGNIKAAGTGTDGLQGVCSNAAFTELWWVPAIHTQAEDRVYRIGQTKKVWINYLVAYRTIEEQLCEIIQKKQSVIREVLDGSIRAGDMDIFDALMEQMEKTK